MRKSELKNFVQIYAEIKNDLLKKRDVIEIIKRNRKVRVKKLSHGCISFRNS